MGYNLLINGIYWGYNPLTNHLLTSWDIQVGAHFVEFDHSQIHGHGIFTDPWMVELLWDQLGKYTGPLEHLDYSPQN